MRGFVGGARPSGDGGAGLFHVSTSNFKRLDTTKSANSANSAKGSGWRSCLLVALFLGERSWLGWIIAIAWAVTEDAPRNSGRAIRLEYVRTVSEQAAIFKIENGKKGWVSRAGSVGLLLRKREFILRSKMATLWREFFPQMTQINTDERGGYTAVITKRWPLPDDAAEVRGGGVVLGEVTVLGLVS